MKKIGQSIVYALVACLILIHCKSAQQSTGPVSLTNTHWHLEQVKGLEIDLAFDPKNDIFLEFSDTAKFVGSTGCNKIFGGYTHEGSKLTFLDMGSTRMDCPAREAEVGYLQALSQVDGYKIEGKKLTLLKGEDHLAVYSKK